MRLARHRDDRAPGHLESALVREEHDGVHRGPMLDQLAVEAAADKERQARKLEDEWPVGAEVVQTDLLAASQIAVCDLIGRSGLIESWIELVRRQRHPRLRPGFVVGPGVLAARHPVAPDRADAHRRWRRLARRHEVGDVLDGGPWLAEEARRFPGHAAAGRIARLLERLLRIAVVAAAPGVLPAERHLLEHLGIGEDDPGESAIPDAKSEDAQHLVEGAYPQADVE